jgi:hypothetical protein
MFETLIANGLGLLAKVGLAKGKDWIKDKTGVDLDKGALSSEDLLSLQKYQMDHEKELLQITLEAQNIEAQEVTKRWSADMGSDSWMSKNIRPGILAAVTAFIGIAIFLPDSYVGKERFDALCSLASLVYIAYFGARTTEKGVIERVVGAWRK